MADDKHHPLAAARAHCTTHSLEGWFLDCSSALRAACSASNRSRVSASFSMESLWTSCSVESSLTRRARASSSLVRSIFFTSSISIKFRRRSPCRDDFADPSTGTPEIACVQSCAKVPAVRLMRSSCTTWSTSGSISSL